MNFREISAQTLRSLSYVARCLIALISLMLFFASISMAWNWPVSRAIFAFFILFALFLSASKNEKGGYFAFLKMGKAEGLTIDTKLVGLEVVVSMLVNGCLLLRHLVASV